MAPNGKYIEDELSEFRTEYPFLQEVPEPDYVPRGILTPEELQFLNSFNFEPISDVESLASLEDPIVPSTTASDDDFVYDNDPVPFLEQIIEEYNVQEADELFEYDINPVTFLEKLLQEDDELNVTNEIASSSDDKSNASLSESESEGSYSDIPDISTLDKKSKGGRKMKSCCKCKRQLRAPYVKSCRFIHHRK